MVTLPEQIWKAEAGTHHSSLLNSEEKELWGSLQNHLFCILVITLGGGGKSNSLSKISFKIF